MLPIEILQVLAQSEEELTAASSPISLSCNRHRQRTNLCMLQFRYNLWREVRRARVRRRRPWQPMEDGRSTIPCIRRISRLRDEALEDVVEGAEVVLIRFAELEEVERRPWTERRFQIDLEMASAIDVSLGVGYDQQERENEARTMISPNDVSNRTD